MMKSDSKGRPVGFSVTAAYLYLDLSVLCGDLRARDVRRWGQIK